MSGEEKAGRGPLGQQDRADGALAETYGRGVQRDSRNRVSHSLPALGIVATVVGAFLSVFG